MRSSENDLGFALQLLPERQSRSEGKSFHLDGSDVYRASSRLGHHEKNRGILYCDHMVRTP